MRSKQDGWSIVLAGIWNRAIFTPEWVENTLFHQPKVETLISIMPYLPIVYRNQQVVMEVSSPRLVFRPRELDDECLLSAERMAHTVLGKLQDTPLMGVGVNFAFVEQSPRRDLVGLFSFADDSASAESGWSTQERRLVRRMQRAMDVLNLTLVFDNQDVAIEFNFHTETRDNMTAREAVGDRVLRLREEALQLLNGVYQLQPLEQEEVNE